VRHLGDDVHLRSVNEIMRYYVHASDGDIGHVQGLIVDEKSWAIRYIVVNTSNWWLGHQSSLRRNGLMMSIGRSRRSRST